MKKFLLLALSAFLTATAYAQDAETPETPEENEGPKWTVTVTRTDVEPNGDGEVYEMTKTDVQISNGDVYSISVPLDVIGNDIKPAKYWFTVTYTEGETVKTSGKTSYLAYKADGEQTVVITAFLEKGVNMRVNFSTNPAAIGDTNLRVLSLFPASKTGQPCVEYFNAGLAAKPTDFKGLGNVDASKSGTEFLTGKSSATYTITPNKATQGVYKATFDYTIATVKVEATTSIDLYIDEVCSFVAPADVTLPEGVSAYTLTFDADMPNELQATEVEGTTLSANTPVILKAEAGNYTFEMTSDPVYNLDTEATPTFIHDVTSSDNVLTGVLQPHYLPEACYTVAGTTCTQWKEEENTDAKGNVTRVTVSPFTAYVALPEEAAEAGSELTIVFPKKEEIEEGGTVGVENVRVESEAQTARTYNIFGQPVDATYKGIVIRGGKKFIQR